jgi:hypothetical protein
MDNYPLIGGSICAVVLLVLASLTNVVGFQTIQSSNQKIISTETNEKELLFQTIIDMANNKEIQKVILGSEITGKRFFDPGMRFSVFTPPVLTKRFLNFAYRFGLILSKTIGKSKMQSVIKQRQVNDQGVQKEINAVIEKDAKLKEEMTQLSSSSCDCENETTTPWDFPVICGMLMLFLFVYWAFQSIGINLRILGNIWTYLVLKFNCMYYLLNS